MENILLGGPNCICHTGTKSGRLKAGKPNLANAPKSAPVIRLSETVMKGEEKEQLKKPGRDPLTGKPAFRQRGIFRGRGVKFRSFSEWEAAVSSQPGVDRSAIATVGAVGKFYKLPVLDSDMDSLLTGLLKDQDSPFAWEQLLRAGVVLKNSVHALHAAAQGRSAMRAALLKRYASRLAGASLQLQRAYKLVRKLDTAFKTP